MPETYTPLRVNVTSGGRVKFPADEVAYFVRLWGWDFSNNSGDPKPEHLIPEGDVWYPTAALAADAGRAALKLELDGRAATYASIGHGCEDCPKCGDPAETDQSTHPGGGMSWWLVCESCGYESDFSA